MNRNYSLNGMRGFCALCILMSHTYAMSIIGDLFPDYGRFNIGKVSVNLFFVVSSYIIISSLLRKHAMLPFLRDRAIRLYPLFLILHLVMFTVGVWGYDYFDSIKSIGDYLWSFFANLFLLTPLIGMEPAQKNTWTLTYQFMFYILAMLIVMLPRKFNSEPLRRSFLALAVIAAAVCVGIYPREGGYFLIGVAVFYALHARKWKLYRNRPIYAANGFILFALMVLTYDPAPYLCMALCVPFFLTIAREEGWFAALMRTKFFQFYGNISYSFYLIHPFVMFALRLVLQRFEDVFPNPYVLIASYFLAGLAITTAASYVSYNIVEVWLTNRYLKKKPAPAPAQPAAPVQTPAADGAAVTAATQTAAGKA